MLEATIDWIRRHAEDNAVELFVSFVVVTIGFITMIINRWVKKRKYTYWKKETLNLGIYTREWEKTEDDLCIELFDDNERLTAENKALKKQYKHLNILLIGSIIFFMLTVYARERVLTATGWVKRQVGKEQDKE